MINKYITATILAVVGGGVAAAQVSRPVPRLVVSIAIDQLRSDYMEAFMPSYGSDGFRKFFSVALFIVMPNIHSRRLTVLRQ